MDIVTGIAAAAKVLQEAASLGTALVNFKNKTEVAAKVSEIVGTLLDTQRQLLQLQGDAMKLQLENISLQQTFSENKELKRRDGQYKLVTTVGGATVLQSKRNQLHYACPTCRENFKQFHVLQDTKSYSGKFICHNCGKQFNVLEAKEPPARPRRRPNFVTDY